MTVQLDRERVRALLVHHHGLDRMHGSGPEAVPALLRQLGLIQVDPLDKVGTNADLVAHARIDGLQRGDVEPALLPGHAFVHFAKERCLIPADRFPRYRERLLEAPWWRHNARMKKVPEAVLSAVEAEIRAHGPLSVHDLSDHGRTTPIDWSGWKGTSKLASLALSVLWTRCRVVAAGRDHRSRQYDVPERALPDHHDAEDDPDWQRATLLDRVDACGLMPVNQGPWWGLLTEVRKPLAQRLLDGGDLVKVGLAGSRRTWLARPSLLDEQPAEPDDRMRILGPLDPLLWDRTLVQLAFDFEYVWEVYKPASQRRWGYYVCPLLHQGRLVGRVEGHREGGALVVDHLWREEDQPFDEAAFERAWARLEAFQ